VPTATGPLEGPAAAADLAVFMLFDTILAFDHAQHRLLLIANARITADDDLEALYQFACARIRFLEVELERSLSAVNKAQGGAVALRANMTKETFEANVRTAKEHIAAGDIYQVVLSQRFEADVTADPFTVYRALRHVNPSPYMYFMRLGGLAIVGSSPEMLVRVEGTPRADASDCRHAASRRSVDEDQRLAEELKRNEKERAEHVMLVDLGRNDIGRVCEYGSCACRSSWRSSGSRTSCTWCRSSKGRCRRRRIGSTRSRRASRRAPCPARRRYARWKSSRRSSRRGAVSTRAPWATSISPAISTSASRFAPW
jgi:anthranilate/para-aminobenzoate synthase component I